MNPLFSIDHHLRGIESGLAKIKSDDTRAAALNKIKEAFMKIIPPTEAPPTETVTVPAPEAPTATLNAAPEIILTPVSDHECEVVRVEPEPTAVELLDGWPMRAELKVKGLFPNRRRLRAELPDGRIVALERKPGLQTGSVVHGKLVLGGRPPLFRSV